MTQENIFLSSEADAWFERNKLGIAEKSSEDDKIFQSIQYFFPNGLTDKRVLEIGCANGYRLRWLKQLLNAEILGVEPSQVAVDEGKQSYLLHEEEIRVATASQFFINNTAQFDLIIFGHSLYLIDPDVYSEIVHGVMKALNSQGYIFIYDFDSPAQRQVYHHRDGIYSYKMPFAELFTWHPQFKMLFKSMESHGGGISVGNCKEDCALSVIRKTDKAFAFPTIAGDIKI